MNGKQAPGWDFGGPNMLEEERVAMCANQEAWRKMHRQPLVRIFGSVTTLRSSGEDSLCHKETDKKKVLTVFRTMAKVNNQPLWIQVQER